MLDFFIELEQKEAAENVSCERAWQLWDYKRGKTRVNCPHCGEDAGTSGIAQSNHGIVFNGWCSKRLFINSRCRSRQSREAIAERVPAKEVDSLWELAQKDMAWLKDRGFEIVDEHDEANYDRKLYAAYKLSEYRNYYWNLIVEGLEPEPCTGHNHSRVFFI